jgi:hypothetical protein
MTNQAYQVYAPATPGSDATLIGQAEKLSVARSIAAQFSHRRDLRMQDVAIYRGSERVEFCGPCR